MSWYYHVMVLSCHGTISIPCHGKCASMWCALVWVTFYVACTDVDIAISMDHKSEFGRGRREKWGMVSQGGYDEGSMGEEGEGQRGKPLPPLSCMCAASVLPHVRMGLGTRSGGGVLVLNDPW